MKRGARSCSPPLTASRKRQAPEPCLSAPSLDCGAFASPRVAALAQPFHPVVKQAETREALGAAFVKDYKDELFDALIDSQDASQPDPGYLRSQPYLTCQHRLRLLNYLFPLFELYNLSSTTIHLCISLLDRYSSRRIVHLRHYQLLGVACLRIAAKYAEGQGRIPLVEDCVALCAESYSANLFRCMERAVLQTLEWRIGATTAMHFLELMLALAASPDKAKAAVREVNMTGCMARMLLDVAALHVYFLQLQPKTLAEATLALSQQILLLGLAPLSPLADTIENQSQDAFGDITTLLLDLSLQMPSAVLERYTTAAECFVATRFQASQVAAEARVQAAERCLQLKSSRGRRDLRPSSSPSPNESRRCPQLSWSLSSSVSSESSSSSVTNDCKQSICVPVFIVKETGSPRPYTSGGAVGGDAKDILTSRCQARSVTPEPIMIFEDV